MTDEGYRIALARPARRAPAEELTESVAAAVMELIRGRLTTGPYRVGKPLNPPFAGQFSARRSIDDKTSTVYVLDVRGRADAYRPR